MEGYHYLAPCIIKCIFFIQEIPGRIQSTKVTFKHVQLPVIVLRQLFHSICGRALVCHFLLENIKFTAAAANSDLVGPTDSGLIQLNTLMFKNLTITLSELVILINGVQITELTLDTLSVEEDSEMKSEKIIINSTIGTLVSES